MGGVLHQAHEPPPHLPPKLPPQLDELIGKALQKKRDPPYQPPADLRADLKRLQREIELANTATPLHPTLPEPSAHPSKRKWGWAGLGVVGCLLLAAIGLLHWRTTQAAPIRSLAVLPLVNTTHDPD